MPSPKAGFFWWEKRNTQREKKANFFISFPTAIRTAIAQGIGKNYFILLELVPKKGVHLQPYEEVYIGEGKRDKIHHIIGRLPMDKLTATGRNELPYIIEDAVTKSEAKFIGFFNTALSLGTRMHQLELLPGFGKKHMWEIIESRKEKPFESLEELKKRVKLIPDPKKSIIKRILLELEGKEKHMLFVDAMS